jgi:hypothetical protein
VTYYENGGILLSVSHKMIHIDTFLYDKIAVLQRHNDCAYFAAIFVSVQVFGGQSARTMIGGDRSSGVSLYCM